MILKKTKNITQDYADIITIGIMSILSQKGIRYWIHKMNIIKDARYWRIELEFDANGESYNYTLLRKLPSDLRKPENLWEMVNDMAKRLNIPDDVKIAKMNHIQIMEAAAKRYIELSVEVN